MFVKRPDEIKKYMETVGYEPMRSALLQFTRLEYFSIRQQEDFPLEYSLSNNIGFVEAVVRVWMKENDVRKLGKLYEWSRVEPNEICYHHRKSMLMA